jgi:hypothetical protein
VDGRRADAIPYLENAVRLEPDNPKAKEVLAEASRK